MPSPFKGLVLLLGWSFVFKSRKINSNPAVFILKRGKGTHLGTSTTLKLTLEPPEELYLSSSIHIGLLFIQLELEVRVRSLLLLPLYPFLKDFGWQFVKTIDLILKTHVTALLPLGLVALLYPAADLLVLGTDYVANRGAGFSSAWHSGTCALKCVDSRSSESPLMCFPGSSLLRPNLVGLCATWDGPSCLLGASLHSEKYGLAEATLHPDIAQVCKSRC